MDIINLILQIVVLVVLFFTLRSYLKANALSREANDISHKTFMVSQCSWVTFEGNPNLGVFQAGICPVTISIKNVSDVPALHFQAFVQYRDISSQWSAPVAMWAPIDTEKALLPRSQYWIAGNIVTSADPNMVRAGIASGHLLFKFSLKYADSFGRNVEITQTYIPTITGNDQQWSITESTVKYDGITPP